MYVLWCLVQNLPKPPQILLLAELSQGWVKTGPHRPGAAMGLETVGFVTGLGKGLGKE